MAQLFRCKAAGCGSILSVEGYCSLHSDMAKQSNDNKNGYYTYAQRYNSNMYNTSRWRKLRKAKLEQNPVCSVCGGIDRLQVHHIVAPKGNETLFYDFWNLQVVCINCHSSITAKECMKK